MKLKTKTTEKNEWNKRKSHDKHLARLKKKTKNILLALDFTDIERIVSKYHAQFYAQWVDKLNKMGLFLKKTTKIHPTWDRQPE